MKQIVFWQLGENSPENSESDINGFLFDLQTVEKAEVLEIKYHLSKDEDGHIGGVVSIVFDDNRKDNE